MVQKTPKHRLTRRLFPSPFYLLNAARYSTLDEKHACASLAVFDIQYFMLKNFGYDMSDFHLLVVALF